MQISIFYAFLLFRPQVWQQLFLTVGVLLVLYLVYDSLTAREISWKEFYANYLERGLVRFSDDSSCLYILVHLPTLHSFLHSSLFFFRSLSTVSFALLIIILFITSRSNVWKLLISVL